MGVGGREREGEVVDCGLGGWGGRVAVDVGFVDADGVGEFDGREG